MRDGTHQIEPSGSETAARRVETAPNVQGVNIWQESGPRWAAAARRGGPRWAAAARRSAVAFWHPLPIQDH
jgi:hypothetical protein